jgi:hypothetical protein
MDDKISLGTTFFPLSTLFSYLSYAFTIYPLRFNYGVSTPLIGKSHGTTMELLPYRVGRAMAGINDN